MSQATAIEWTDATWNPVTGCDIVSPGCKHCYAMTLAKRLKAMGNPRYQRDGEPPTSGPGFGLTLHPDKLAEPARWRKPRRVFVNSMSDLFHPDVPSEFINDVWMAMYNNPRHTYQVLTKRPERMRDWTIAAARAKGWPDPAELWPDWIWLGTSIESRTYVGRADILRETPCSVRFISAEPLLGPLMEPFRRDIDGDRFGPGPTELDLTGIDWLIVGGESGPKHRPMDPQWVRDLRDAALLAGTAFFLKQDSGPHPGRRGRFADVAEWPQRFPEIAYAA